MDQRLPRPRAPFKLTHYQAAMQARASHDGHGLQQEMRLALDEHLAPRTDHEGSDPVGGAGYIPGVDTP